MRKGLSVALGACIFFAIAWYLAVRGPGKRVAPEQTQNASETNQGRPVRTTPEGAQSSRITATPPSDAVVPHPSETRLPGISVNSAAPESIPTNGIRPAA